MNMELMGEELSWCRQENEVLKFHCKQRENFLPDELFNLRNSSKKLFVHVSFLDHLI